MTRFFNVVGHLGRKFPYGDVSVVVTLEQGARPG
jgi:hypothetical protein